MVKYVKEKRGEHELSLSPDPFILELDVQTRVTQTFDTNRQEVKAEINSVIDNAKDIVNNPNATPKQIAEANQKIEDMQHLGVLVDSIAGALYSPADSTLGTVANTLSPAIVYEIGQYFKKNEELNKLDNGNRPEEGSAAHILAQTLVAAATSSLAGNDALTAGLSAGGAEIIAPKLAEWLYGVDDASELTSEQKNTISAIISLGSAAVGATTGETTDVISSSVAGTVAVVNNTMGNDPIMKIAYGDPKEMADASEKAALFFDGATIALIRSKYGVILAPFTEAASLGLTTNKHLLLLEAGKKEIDPAKIYLDSILWILPGPTKTSDIILDNSIGSSYDFLINYNEKKEY